MKTLPILTETTRTKISRLFPVLWKWFTAAYRIMATNTSGMIITSAWAEVKAARAVDPEEVDVATVPTNARPITISSRTSSIFISAPQTFRELKKYSIYTILSMATKGNRNFPEGKFPSTVVKVKGEGDDPRR